MASLADDMGADSSAIFAILRADARIGSKAYLTPGLGFGGRCLPKDTVALEAMAVAAGHPLRLLEAATHVNRSRIPAVVGWLRESLGTLQDSRVFLGGLAFKPGTDDLRESPSVKLARALAAEGATIAAWDPVVRTKIADISVFDQLEPAITGADALVIGHAWAGWQDLDPARVRRLARGRWVHDSARALPRSVWIEHGFMFHGPARRARQSAAV